MAEAGTKDALADEESAHKEEEESAEVKERSKKPKKHKKKHRKEKKERKSAFDLPPHVIEQLRRKTPVNVDISPDKDKSIVRTIKVHGNEGEFPLETINEGAWLNARVIGFYEEVKFMDSELKWQIGECLTVGLPEGVDHVIRRMRRGETCETHLQPKWGYRNAVPPGLDIPGGAELDFELTLIDFESVTPWWQMTCEEKISTSLKVQEAGKHFFDQGEWVLARIKYNRVVILTWSKEYFEKFDALERRNPLHLEANLKVATCWMKLNDHQKVIDQMDFLLEKFEGNVEALLMRAQAKRMKGDYAESIEDYERAVSRDPRNRRAVRELEDCRRFADKKA